MKPIHALIACCLIVVGSARAAGPLDNIPRMVYLAGPYSPFVPCTSGVTVSDIPFPVKRPVTPKPAVGASQDEWAKWHYQVFADVWDFQADLETYKLAQCSAPLSDRDLLAAFIASQLKSGRTGPTVIKEAQDQLAALKAATSKPTGSTTFP